MDYLHWSWAKHEEAEEAKRLEAINEVELRRIEAENREVITKLKAKQHSQRLLHIILFIVATAAVGLGILALYAASQRRHADLASTIAILAKERAEEEAAKAIASETVASKQRAEAEIALLSAQRARAVADEARKNEDLAFRELQHVTQELNATNRDLLAANEKSKRILD